MSMGRDSQRNKLYSAEHDSFYVHTQDFGTIRHAQKYSNSITGSRWWRGLGGPTFVLIKEARSDSGYSTAWGNRNEIRLARRHQQKWVLIHELAHIAMWHLAKNQPAHGAEYALIYRRLVEEFLGDDARKKLSNAYEQHGVKSNTSDRRVIKALASASGNL